MQQRGFLIRAMSLIAVGFGLLTIKEGGAILFGGEAAQASAGNFVPFVLWFNFLAGFATSSLALDCGCGIAGRCGWPSSSPQRLHLPLRHSARTAMPAGPMKCARSSR